MSSVGVREPASPTKRIANHEITADGQAQQVQRVALNGVTDEERAGVTDTLPAADAYGLVVRGVGASTEATLDAVRALVALLATEATLEDARALLASIDAALSGGLAVTGPITDAELRATPVDVGIPGLVSAENSSAVALGAGATFTGAAVDVTDYAAILVSVATDQDSAAGGLSLESSADGSNWDHVETYTITGDTAFFIHATPRARHFRVRLTNGATPQGHLRLQTILSVVAPTPRKRPIEDVPVDGDPVQLTKAVITGHTTAMGGGYVDVKVSPSGAVQVGGSVDADVADRAARDVGRVRDRHTDGEVLEDQVGDGSVKTFTFASPVQLVWVRCDGGDARAQPFSGGDDPSGTFGLVVEDGIAVPIAVQLTTLRVFASTGTINVWGSRE